MYQAFYTLTADPFRLTPEQIFRYEHGGYAKARAIITSARAHAEGMVVLTGCSGSGKTTLMEDLLDSCPRHTAYKIRLTADKTNPDGLLNIIAREYLVETDGVPLESIIRDLTKRLVQWKGEGRPGLIVVDEAHHLSAQALQDLGVLLDLKSDGQSLAQVFLSGQPELRQLLQSPALDGIDQRIVVSHHMGQLDTNEIRPYIIRRLKTVGWVGDPEFDSTTFPPIEQFSKGNPRKINLVCGRLMLLGSLAGSHKFTGEDALAVINELQAEGLDADFGDSAEAEESAPIQDLRSATGQPAESESAPIASHVEELVGKTERRRSTGCRRRRRSTTHASVTAPTGSHVTELSAGVKDRRSATGCRRRRTPGNKQAQRKSSIFLPAIAAGLTIVGLLTPMALSMLSEKEKDPTEADLAAITRSTENGARPSKYSMATRTRSKEERLR